LLNVVASLFKSKSRLEAENAALRHQLIVLQRKVRGRGGAFLAGGSAAALTKAITATAAQFFVEVAAKGDKRKHSNAVV
jgi:hypothetical protein